MPTFSVGAPPSPPARGRGLKHRGSCAEQGGLVAPRAGAWIETTGPGPARPSRRVAPRAGAWIETSAPGTLKLIPSVAPRAGAWIETIVVHGHSLSRGSP